MGVFYSICDHLSKLKIFTDRSFITCVFCVSEVHIQAQETNSPALHSRQSFEPLNKSNASGGSSSLRAANYPTTHQHFLTRNAPKAVIVSATTNLILPTLRSISGSFPQIWGFIILSPRLWRRNVRSVARF